MLNQSLFENSDGHDRVRQMAITLGEEAMKLGLAELGQVRLQILGSTKPDGIEVSSRTAIVSTTQPVASSTDVELWVNPDKHAIYRSLPADRTWHEVFSRVELFTR